MPFPSKVREQALVAAARHCCVCHRYKGVKVEVHHIVPETKGGTNRLDNAIALCFDCHADAGHYDPEHPRGTKFSPDELRRARDTWYDIVQRDEIAPPSETDTLYCRYLICKTFEAFREVTVGNLSRMPFDKPFVVVNEVQRFHARLIENHPSGDRREQEWGDSFENREVYAKAHPDVRIVERSWIDLYPYFEAIRKPSIEELRQKLAPSDVVTRLLVENGVPAREISLVLAYDEVCGEAHFQEIYRIRPLWALYLAATNLRSNPVTLQSMLCEMEQPAGLGYRYLTQRLASAATEEPFPAAAIPAGATAIVPLATLLGPVEETTVETFSEEIQDLQIDLIQKVSHDDLGSAYARTAMIGPAMWPRELRLIDGGTPRQQQVHEFNLSNLYMIDRAWLIGSCPHLFACDSRLNTHRYIGELFAREPGITQTHRVQVHPGVRALVISELEPERTIIEEISVNGIVHIAGALLSQGQSLKLEVSTGDRIVIVGRYETSLPARQQPWLRNRLIRQYIHRQNGLGDQA